MIQQLGPLADVTHTAGGVYTAILVCFLLGVSGPLSCDIDDYAVPLEFCITLEQTRELVNSGEGAWSTLAGIHTHSGSPQQLHVMYTSPSHVYGRAKPGWAPHAHHAVYCAYSPIPRSCSFYLVTTQMAAEEAMGMRLLCFCVFIDNIYTYIIYGVFACLCIH